MEPPGSSCLSIFGLPFDASEREVHVLFSGCTGYSRCVVVPGKTAAQKPYAFVQFSSPDEAMMAAEARQGSTWEAGAQPVSIELAKRDIPETFVPRQPQPLRAAAGGPLSGPVGGPLEAPPRKRPRLEAYGHGALSQVRGGGDGPRTLHLGGLPGALTQEDLDAFLAANFDPHSLRGGTLSPASGGAQTGRAFVGFTSHEAAQEAQGLLDGFVWDGCTLRAEWARTEFRPTGGASGAGPAFASGPSRPPAFAPALAWGGGGCIGACGGGGKGKAFAPWGGAKGSAKGGRYTTGGRRTLHFTNLPPVEESECGEFLEATFPQEVASVNFKDARDGRPPVAWVLFESEASAAEAASSHATFEWQGTQVRVAYARTELCPR